MLAVLLSVIECACHVTDIGCDKIGRSLHWLPVAARIGHKFLTPNVQQDRSCLPSGQNSPVRISSGASLCIIRSPRATREGSWHSQHAELLHPCSVWNDLPPQLHTSPSLRPFRRPCSGGQMADRIGNRAINQEVDGCRFDSGCETLIRFCKCYHLKCSEVCK